MAFPNIVFGSSGDQFVTTSTNTCGGPLGTQLVLPDGRKFRYAEKSAAAAVAGDVQSSAAPVANHVLQTPAAAAVGARSVVVTLGATAATANQYEDGFLTVDIGTGFGYMYGVTAHPAVASAGEFTVPIKETVQVAIPATANSVSLIPNRWKGVVVAPTTETGSLAGVAVKPIAASAFGWLQTRGEAMVKTAGTNVAGEPVAMITTAGALGPAAAVTTNICGIVRRVATTTNMSTIDLQIDG